MLAMAALFIVGCADDGGRVGVRTEALSEDAWQVSKWISVVDAPVVTGNNSKRAADGASWFVSTLTNEQAVVSAKWMTTALGVYDIYKWEVDWR